MFPKDPLQSMKCTAYYIDGRIITPNMSRDAMGVTTSSPMASSLKIFSKMAFYLCFYQWLMLQTEVWTEHS
jgi:hypothetical protein